MPMHLSPVQQRIAARQLGALKAVPEGWSSADEPTTRTAVDRRGRRVTETTLTVFWVADDQLPECSAECGWMVVARGPRHTTFGSACAAIRAAQFGCGARGVEVLCCYDSAGARVQDDRCIGDTQKFRATFTSRRAGHASCEVM
eukprot:m51a1_g9769 hypothetical protein (144) ;mRNA; r:1653923-1654354